MADYTISDADKVAIFEDLLKKLADGIKIFDFICIVKLK